MATLADTSRMTAPDDGHRFFLRSAILMTVVIFGGFSTQLAMGRSSFSLPLIVHAHAIVFMGWVVLNLLQNIFASSGSMTLHRRLGWIGAAWIVPMVVLGCAITVYDAQVGRAPFFFRPLHFLILDPMSVFFFAGLTIAAIVMRRQTGWHKRLHFCAMSILLGPGLGRLLPMPLLQPWAFEVDFAVLMLFPVAGVIADIRRSGRIHPAWHWGIGAMVASLVLIELITYSPVGLTIYDAVTAGTPGAAIPPLEFAPPPGH